VFSHPDSVIRTRVFAGVRNRPFADPWVPHSYSQMITTQCLFYLSLALMLEVLVGTSRNISRPDTTHEKRQISHLFFPRPLNTPLLPLT
jgi:hypothetical protein